MKMRFIMLAMFMMVFLNVVALTGKKTIIAKNHVLSVKFPGVPAVSSPHGKALVKAKTSNAEATPDPSETVGKTFRSALIDVLDTSPSTAKKLDQMKDVARQLLQAAPPESALGVVGIDSQAIKKLFAQPATADRFIQSLVAGGKFSDLGRGTDAALSLVQEANVDRAVIVYLTDGDLTVPKSFKDQADFTKILVREFTSRPGIRVFVVNVGGRPLAKLDMLPPNVTVLSLSNWQAVMNELQQTMKPQIQSHLAESSPTTSPTSQPVVLATPHRSYFYTTWSVALGLLTLALFAAIFIWKRSRRRSTKSLIETPEKLMRPEDLKPVEPEPAPEPVALLEIESNGEFDAGGLGQFISIRQGETVTLGGSPFAASRYLVGLKQAQTLAVAFEGLTLKGFRLRPDKPHEVDEVKLNQSDAPIEFIIKDGDLLTIGSYRIKPLFTDEASLALFDTSPSVEPTAPPTITREGQRRLNRGRSRANAST